jgi:hypothetical protein
VAMPGMQQRLRGRVCGEGMQLGEEKVPADGGASLAVQERERVEHASGTVGERDRYLAHGYVPSSSEDLRLRDQ